MCKNRKGGVGKTTIATHLADGLSRRGYRVLAIDFDTQNNLKTSFRDRLISEITMTSGHLLVGDPKQIDINNMIHQINDKLHIIVSESGLQTVSNMLASERNGGVKKLERVFQLNGVDEYYDFVIFDLPSEMNAISDTVTNITDLIVAPSTLETDSVNGVVQLVKELEDFVESGVFESGDDVPSLLVVPMVFQTNKRKSNEYYINKLKEFEDMFETSILTPMVRQNARFSHAREKGITIYDLELNDNYRKEYRIKSEDFKRGVEDMEAVIDRVLEELQ